MDDEVLRRARIRAVTEGTTVNSLVRQYIAAYADNGASEQAAMAELLAIAQRSTASSGPQGRIWTRNELHER
jgi:plasmid stability protein